MVRVKRGYVAKNRRKKILKFSKGFKGAHSRLFRTARGQVMKALVYSYIGRKKRKQDFRKIWICRINAEARKQNLTYSKIKNSLRTNSIGLNLKSLSQTSVFDDQATALLYGYIKYFTL